MSADSADVVDPSRRSLPTSSWPINAPSGVQLNFRARHLLASVSLARLLPRHVSHPRARVAVGRRRAAERAKWIRVMTRD